MKILIVDDSSRKVNKTYKVLDKIDGFDVNEMVESESDIGNAKTRLINTQYDFLILDLNLPTIRGGDNDRNGGLDFLDEIIKDTRILKPENIIILTEFDELKSKYCESEYNYMFEILKYDESSLQWERELEEKVKYSLLKQSRTPKVDVAIITAVQIEFETFKGIYSNWIEYTSQEDRMIYYCSDVSINGKIIKVLLTKQSKMGMTEAATLASKIIHKFKPDYMVMVGIAASTTKELKYGDIIIAEEVWDYASGKIVGEEFRPDAKYISVDRTLLHKVSNYDKNILFSISQKWRGKSIPFKLAAISGTFACGPAVIANENFVQERILKHSRKTIGIDMESFGILSACENSIYGSVKSLCIKSVSDYADSEKGDDYQEYAAFTSTMFAKYVIEELLFKK